MKHGDRISKWESQVRKGVLDFVVLICLQDERLYGYDLISRLKQRAELDVSEGTIYPLLNRMARDELVEAEWVEMPTGMPRKYYHLTAKGREALEDMKVAWRRFRSSVDGLLEH